jgi:Protein of unknown function (DUF3761)
MKTTIRLILVAAGLMASHGLMAQAPAGAPAGATGICKDGTYWTGASKSGACSGHKGVQTWYAGSTAAAPAATPASKPPAAMPAPTPSAAPVASKAAPTPAASKPAAATTSTAAAPGGGPGMVWVNTDSKVYHCPGTQYYGKTKQGKYMSEADAKAMGAHADHNKPCTN